MSTPVCHHAEGIEVHTRGRGTHDITGTVQQAVANSGLRQGLCTLFVHHTSASVILCENADPAVRRDLEEYTARLVLDGDPEFEHTAEGPDDMSAHIRTILTQSSLGIPMADGRCDLGVWQGIYLWEHRTMAHTRRLTVSVVGH